MEKKTVFKLLSVLFIILLPIIYFNWGVVSAGLLSFNQYSIVIIILGLLALGPAYLFGKWLELKAHVRTIGSISTTKLKQVLKQEQREKNARECLNRFRKTDPYLMATRHQEMEIISRIPSPSRDDAVQWEMFVFTTEEEYANFDPSIGIEGIAPERLFFVMVNCHTGESYFQKFENYDAALEWLRNIWNWGIKKIEASEIEKQLASGVLQGMGMEAAKSSSSDSGDKTRREENE